MTMVRHFEERAESVGHQALTKEATVYPDPVCVAEEGEVIPGKKVKKSSQETSRVKSTAGGWNRDGKESW